MELNRKNIRKILLIILFTVVCFLSLQNIGLLVHYLKLFFSLLSPIIVGFCIAFILNLPMKGIEKLLFKTGGKHDKLVKRIKRPVSILLTFILVAVLLMFVMLIVVPELGSTFEILKENFPGYIDKVNGFINGLVTKFPDLKDKVFLITTDWEKLLDTALSFLQKGAGNVLNSTVSAATSVINGLVNFFLGLFFAIYFLSQKERLISQCKRFIKAYMPDKKNDDGTVIPAENRVKRLMNVLSLTNKTFSSFIAGQCTEAAILGLMFFIVLSIFGYKYALMISVLTIVCALIPIFGAWVSTSFAFILTLMAQGFMPAVWLLVIAIILQQIEGNLIYPHVVGSSVGLPSIWVLAAVTLGASTIGVLGILIYIPVFSVIYSLLKDGVHNKLKEKVKTDEAQEV